VRFIRRQVAEVKTTDALKRLDFDTSVAPTYAGNARLPTVLGGTAFGNSISIWPQILIKKLGNGLNELNFG
jgi:hypothetical protein